jgi:ABC-type multidrug transport system ATPase subunit
MGLYSSQLRAMLKRNLLTKKASLSNLILEIIFPIVVVVLAYIVDSVSSTEKFNVKGPQDAVDVNGIFTQYSTTSLYENSEPAIGFVLPKNNKDKGIVDKIMGNEIFNKVKPIIFDNESKIDEYYNDYKNLLIASVVFESDDYLHYTLRVNDTSAPDPYTQAISNHAEGRHLEATGRKTEADKYFSVFAPVQAAVDQALIQLKTKDDSFSMKLSLGKLGKDASEYNGSKSTSGTIATYIALIFLAPLMLIVTYLVKEKEKGVKEGLIIAGVHPSIFWLSWEIIYAVIVLVVSIIITAFFLVAKCFDNVNPIIMFVALLLYGLSCCSFGFLFTTFFNKFRTAGTVVGLIGFALCVFNIALAYFSRLAKIITSFIFSQFAIGSFIYEADQMDYHYQNLNFSNIFSSDAGIYLGILVVNNIIYFVLAVLFDNFSVGQNSRYIFRSKRKPSDIQASDEVTYEKDIQEDYNAKNGEKCLVEVSRVHKIYQKDVIDFEIEDGEQKEVTKSVDYLAVNDVSFKVYQNEIFAILGPNGAGKSTLLNIMVGLIKGSQGDIYYDGMSLNADLNKIRRDFGVCPQSNIIFDELTVEDHIEIYAGIKNTEVNVDEILKEVDLLDQKEKKASKLSGGQKRKLCIALAIVGNPKYIFLDEPTTGLDPLSRRKIWDLLLKKKEGRVIFLTTHYMDEADVIADRKLILNEGKIRCLGTSLYLKNHFKMNYEVSVESVDKDAVEEIILRHVPNAVYVPTEESMTKDGLVKVHSWKLPLTETSSFTPLLDELESRSVGEQSLVKKFALSMPTLEELFIRLEDEGSHMEEVGQNSGSEQVLIDTEEDKLPELKQVKSPSQFSMIKCLIEYRLKIFLKNKGFATSSILYPVLIAGFCFFVVNNTFNNKTSYFDSKEMTMSEMYKNSILNFDTGNSNLDFTNDDFVFSVGNDKSHIANNDYTRIPYPEFNQPYCVSSISGQKTNNNYQFNIYYNDTMTHSIPVTINAISNAILTSRNATDSIVISSRPYNQKNETLSQIALMFAALLVGGCIISCMNKFGPLVVRERVNLLLQQLQINGVFRINYWISTLVADYFVSVLTCILIVIAGIIVQFQPLLNFWVILIIVVSIIVWCLPTLIYQYIWNFAFNKEETAYSVMSMINVYPIIFGYIASFAICAMDHVTENIIEDGVLYNYYYIVLSIVLTVFFPAYGIIAITNSLYTMRIYEALYNYRLSFGTFFKIRNGVLPVLITLVVLIFVYFILWVRFDIKSQNLTAEIRQFPPKLHRKYEELLEEGDEDVNEEAKFAYKHQDELPISVLHLSKEYDTRVKLDGKEKKEMLLRSQEDFEYGDIHPSLFNKKKLVKTAVVDVNFAVRVRECFGLLGPNGAGKTTTLNVITSSIPPTTGKVCFYGKEINTTAIGDLSMGYCPQINVLWKQLTLREHIKLFLRIRGYNKKEAMEYATKYINACGLEDHQHKPAITLSGGTKRKLSLLIAICGYPKQILLDEPTAGMDPSTRRYIWNVINDTKKMNESALILTTHSMEEAEQLCDRLAILVNGRLTCIGAPEHLKMKFGEGYVLELQAKNAEEFHTQIIEKANIFNNNKYTMENISANHVKYEVKMNGNLGRVFKIMEECKANGLVIDYTFSQSSLEQIFINFAKQQITEVDDESTEGNY